jgi:hypothetical protein
VQEDEQFFVLFKEPMMDVLWLAFEDQAMVQIVANRLRQKAQKQLKKWKSPYFKAVYLLKLMIELSQKKQKKKVFFSRGKFSQKPRLEKVFQQLSFFQQALLILETKHQMSFPLLSDVFELSAEHLQMQKYFALEQMSRIWK